MTAVDIIVLAAVAVGFAAAVVKIIFDKVRGKGGCDCCNCGGCPSHGKCRGCKK